MIRETAIFFLGVIILIIVIAIISNNNRIRKVFKDDIDKDKDKEIEGDNIE